MTSIVYFSHPQIENLYPLTEKEKPLPNQHLLGKPIVVRVSETLLKSGFKDIVIAYPQISKEARETLEEKAKLIDISDSDIWEGLSTALGQAENEDVILLLGTQITNQEFYEGFLVSWDEVGREPMATIIPPEEEGVTEGVLRINVKADFLSKRIEKAILLKRGIQQISSYSLGGIIAARKEWFTERFRGEEDFFSVLIDIMNTQKPYFHLYTGRFTSLNNPWSILDAMKTVLSKVSGVSISENARVSPTAVLEGPVIVDDFAYIDHYTVIKGPAYIGKKALVGTHSFIRSYTSVEENAVVGSGAEIKRSYIGRLATVGSKSHVTDSLVGDSSTIRPLVVTLNYDPREAKKKPYVKRGSIIGHGSIVNGGSVLPPRKVIPPNNVYP
jgi:glucose-1-phosphate thymidylyltransferase